MQNKKFIKIFNLIIHLAAWIGLTIVAVYSSPEYLESNKQDWFFHGLMSIQFATFFYLVYFLFVPKFLIRRKFLLFFIFVVVSIIGFSCISEMSFYYLHHFGHAGPPPIIPNPPPEFFHHHPPAFDTSRGFFIYIIVFVISTAIKMTSEWFKFERQKKEIENYKLRADLAMLKAQLNPHFFFNVLNNICSLARSKSDETETYIIKLSQLMRYNLYEQKDEKVMLSKEIQFIEDYIAIQKMRMDDTVEIGFHYLGELDHCSIEPMLLYPFIENAFKYGISYNNISKIIINLNVENHVLSFSVFNFKYNTGQDETINKRSGVGLENVLKRLKLLYPAKHEISIQNNTKTYTVNLKLELS